MTFKPQPHSPRFAWYPCQHGCETQQDYEERITEQWLQDHVSFREAEAWKREFRSCGGISPVRLLTSISRRHTPELVDLLYPRSPRLFQNSRLFTLSSMLFSDMSHPDLSPEILQQCLQARQAHLNAACLFAITGATACLETLLAQGADPDGLDNPDSWSYIHLSPDWILPVAPMDCALLTDNEDCRLVLELFGGKTLAEHLPI